MSQEQTSAMVSAALLGRRRKERATAHPRGCLGCRAPAAQEPSQRDVSSVSFFACKYPVLPAPFVIETVLPPLSIPGSLVKQELALCAWVRFWALDSVLLVCVSFSASMIPFRLLSLCSIV